MQRRSLLKGVGAAGLSLAAPSIAAAQGARVLKFIPHADLTVLDPIWTTAYVTRNHGYLVYDTLFGMDNAYKASPQIAEGMTVENDGKLVKITLRAGLKWHDGEKVLARDCVASIKRWGARDTFGQSRMAATDELSAADMQRQAFADVPYIPLGQVKGVTAYRKNITGVLQGIPSFWSVQRATA